MKVTGSGGGELLVIIFCISLVLIFFFLKNNASTGRLNLPYKSKAVLTKWESKTLSRLIRQVPSGYYVCPQVRLKEILQVSGKDRKALWMVTSKSIDFVIIDLDSGLAKMAIELDDRTHSENKRRSRDFFVDAVFEKIGVPLLRFSPKQSVIINQDMFERKEDRAN